MLDLFDKLDNLKDNSLVNCIRISSKNELNRELPGLKRKGKMERG